LAPVSFQQEYLWNTQRSNPCDNIPLPVSLRLAGDLNVDCLQAALQEVVRRHESLRTRICVVDGIPKQQIEEEGEYRLMQVDLRTASHDGNLNGAARSLVEQFISRPMDLAADPLFQVQLITLSDQEHVLAIAIHHIITEVLFVAGPRRFQICLCSTPTTPSGNEGHMAVGSKGMQVIGKNDWIGRSA
jgi:NRPS condensation-like uncharacterized protein